MIETSTPPAGTLSRLQHEMIDSCGRVCQLLGLPRSTGQIYGLLYFSIRPLCLDEIARILKISKASCSTGTRQLCAWNAIRLVWIHGERKDHFEADPELANLLRVGYSKFLKPRVSASGRRLEHLSTALDEDVKGGIVTREEFGILSERLKNFSDLHQKLQMFVPLTEKLLGVGMST